MFEALEVDASANCTQMAFVLLGIIPTVLFAWAFEMNPEGIKRDGDVVPDEFQDFWRGDHLPMFEPFNDLPGAIALQEAYEKKLSEQRASLMAML